MTATRFLVRLTLPLAFAVNRREGAQLRLPSMDRASLSLREPPFVSRLGCSSVPRFRLKLPSSAHAWKPYRPLTESPSEIPVFENVGMTEDGVRRLLNLRLIDTDRSVSRPRRSVAFTP